MSKETLKTSRPQPECIVSRVGTAIFTSLMAWLIALPSPFADTPELVKEKTEQAKDHLNRGEYTEALSTLKSLYEIKPTPLVMFNIAMCYKALSQHIEAIDSFHQYLEMEKEWREINPKLHNLTKKALEELYELVGRLEITDAPPEAEVTIDDKRLGVTPQTKSFYLLPGKHTLKVVKEGLEPLEISVVIAAGAKVLVRADLVRPLSKLQVVCNEKEAFVTINGENVGMCPYEAELAPGTYNVHVTAPYKKPVNHQVDAIVGKTTVLAVELESIAPPPPIVPPAPMPDYPSPSKQKRLFGIGTSGVVLGVASIAIGAIANSKYKSYRNELITRAGIYEDMEQAVTDRESGVWTDLNSKLDGNFNAESTYNKGKGHYAGAVVGYTLGGVLISVGCGLLIKYWMNKKELEKKGSERRAVSPHHPGLSASY